jgi:hypothetical protein
MKLCPICFKSFHVYGFKNHLDYCKRKKEYYKKPVKCLNPNCENIITYELWYRNKQKFCCRLCAYTKERREAIGKQSKMLLQTCPEIFKNFGKVNSINIKYEQKDGKIVNLQSSYEEKVAIELDKYDVKWIRPSYLKYIDIKGNSRKYFPDFYLIDYDVYLDPKNDYLIKTDIDKINRSSKQNNVKIFILREKELKWNKILTLIHNSNGL